MEKYSECYNPGIDNVEGLSDVVNKLNQITTSVVRAERQRLEGFLRNFCQKYKFKPTDCELLITKDLNGGSIYTVQKKDNPDLKEVLDLSKTFVGNKI